MTETLFSALFVGCLVLLPVALAAGILSLMVPRWRSAPRAGTTKHATAHS